MGTCTTYRRVVSGEAEGFGASLARGALRALSVPYGIGSSLAEIAKSGHGGTDVGLPVVSIGNITCGGTGKTPLVSLVVGELLKRGRRPVILSRGYASRRGEPNDEARLLARAHPDVLHLQGKDREALARYAADAKLGDVLVLDDGFQYQRLRRDLNVCAIDATNPFGYGAVLPRGLLREPLAGLYRARPVVITRCELVQPAEIAAIRREILRWNEHARIVLSEMRPTGLVDLHGGARTDVTSLRDRSVLLASGVGNPDAFTRTVRRLGARVRGHVQKADHHDWSAAEIADLARRARALSVDAVVTTTKDAVKLARFPWPADAPPARVLDIEVVITEGADQWKKLLDDAVKGRLEA